MMDELLANPLIPASVLGALALLVGFGVYRMRQKRKVTQVDSSFLESRLQPDSFFGASGGQRIDTAESNNPTGSSMVYSPSQLDAAGDVDPVAEADVYLAYGRDLQAEEILKEALRTSPQRVAIHAKLLEIYAKRRDPKAFEVVATDAYNLTHGAGQEWEHICDLGRELDPANPMYRPGGQPGASAVSAIAAGTAGAAATATFAATQTVPMHLQTAAAQAPPPASDLDLDLDFSLGDDEPAPMATPEPTLKMSAIQPEPPPPTMGALDMDFGGPTVAMKAADPMSLDMPAEPVRLEAPDLTLNENSLSFTPEPLPGPAPAAAPAAPDVGMIEFDLGALSLDLGSPAGGDTAGSPLSTGPDSLSTGGLDDGSGDPLATKLALAEEFNAIGDADGARSLAEEVVAEASGDLRSRAQKLLAEIG
jgi:pilus assembly protein FimV